MGLTCDPGRSYITFTRPGFVPGLSVSRPLSVETADKDHDRTRDYHLARGRDTGAVGGDILPVFGNVFVRGERLLSGTTESLF